MGCKLLDRDVKGYKGQDGGHKAQGGGCNLLDRNIKCKTGNRFNRDINCKTGI